MTTTTADSAPAAICWHDRPRGDCRHALDDHAYIRWGRCRSGRRWFWTAAEMLPAASADDIDAAALHGTAGSEGEATGAAREAVARIAAGHGAVAEMRHGDASRLLRKLNTERRADRPAAGETAAAAVEYVYGARLYYPDDWTLPEVREVVAYRVTRKTAKRVYYIRDELHGQAGHVDREALERGGQVQRRSARWHEDDSTVYATREAAEEALGLGRQDHPAAPDLTALKREMAGAHPDRGGTAEEFIAARVRYEQALRAAS